MSSFTINMDGSQAAGYRYTMPQLEVTQEGKKRSRLSNLGKVSAKVGRTCEMLVAFFNHEVPALKGTPGFELRNGTYSVPSTVEQSVLQSAVLDFIQKHVMCSNCGNPETRICALQDDTRATVLECDACGQTAPCQNADGKLHQASAAFFKWMQTNPEHLEAIGRLRVPEPWSCADEAGWSFPQSSDAVASDDWVS
jgi:translation initiation factor 2 beta subunit (eIF-2beta)/eIF-5